MGTAKRRTDINRARADQAVKTLIPDEALQGVEGLITMINLLNTAVATVPEMAEGADKKVTEMDYIYGDLTHAVELADFQRRESYDILQKLKENRIERRQYKDFIQMSEPLVRFLKAHPEVVKGIKEIHAHMHRIEGSLQNRKYKVRSLKDMEEAFQKAGMRTTGQVLADVQLSADVSDGGVLTSEVKTQQENAE